MRIGITYLKGSVPGFEDFGNIVTDLVKSNGLVNGVPANRELDGLIIPGGTLIESGGVSEDLIKEIKTMNRDGKFIYAVCSGFQLLSNSLDLGRKSPCPIKKEGLGILDVDISPLISSDRADVIVKSDSFLTKGLNDKVLTGFHSHTYGKVEGDATVLFKSKLKRMNYSNKNTEIVSGVKNSQGNVVGTMVHGLLDENQVLIENILDFIGKDEDDLLKAKEINNSLLKKIRSAIGIESGIISNDLTIQSYLTENIQKENKQPPMLMIASNGSDSGKTFITTGLAGAIKKRGLNVAVLKVGSDSRDVLPSLYLTKENMEYYTCIKIGNLGWADLEETLSQLKESHYDIVLVEGVMSILTGVLNEIVPYSAVEIALAGNIPVLMITGCNKGGIESASVDISNHSKLIKSMGVDVKAVLLNKVYNEDIFNRSVEYIKNNSGVEEVLQVPKLKLESRGNTPEVQLDLEEFTKSAMNTVENSLDIESIIKMAKTPNFKGYKSLEELEKFFNTFN